MENVQIKSITIERLEGYKNDCFTAIAASFEQAEHILKLMAKTASDKGYDKVNFLIEWSDDVKYEGRIGLQERHGLHGYDLRNHIQNSMEYRINQQSIPQDARITQKEYDEFVSTRISVS